ncbi:EAL domain-containing protein [uncultured Desulfobacter sp.]|uniref:EAL domain-containing protein n=1 Tax=uncultured Desulfobacter sp. TaxID=240139 RepID=UPI0029C6DC52|nr:EAL domain-containing protein [uncultured Desulfobacter sp.]
MKQTLKLDLNYIRQWAEYRAPFMTGKFNTLNLMTALQPVYSLAHKRVVGHEALVRIQDEGGAPVSPAILFDHERSAAEVIHIDRLCRFIHIHNYRIIKTSINWLFLNVSPITISSGRKAYGSYFNELLKFHDFPPHRIVIEVVENPIGENGLLMETVAFFRELGCLIAIDDFGAGHSNFDRIWTLQPDIVKLDRSFLSFLCRADRNPEIRQILSGIVTLLHQAGALVLMEGVETRDQAMIAIESDVDFVQGFFFGRPFTNLKKPPPEFDGFNPLLADFKSKSHCSETKFRQGIRTYRIIFERAVSILKAGGCSMDTACRELLSTLEVVRCYLIDTEGIQIGQTLVTSQSDTMRDKRFKPLEDASSADWFRRHYLRRAIYHPDQVQVTRPYLSITGAHMCVTLSMKFTCPAGDCILCCDLKV